MLCLSLGGGTQVSLWRGNTTQWLDGLYIPRFPHGQGEIAIDCPYEPTIWNDWTDMNPFHLRWTIFQQSLLSSAPHPLCKAIAIRASCHWGYRDILRRGSLWKQHETKVEDSIASNPHSQPFPVMVETKVGIEWMSSILEQVNIPLEMPKMSQ